jgi:rRNA maturation protein Nop10
MIDEKILKLQYHCPECGKKFRARVAMQSATVNFRETCARCGNRYSITVTPHPIRFGIAHVASITNISTGGGI